MTVVRRLDRKIKCDTTRLDNGALQATARITRVGVFNYVLPDGSLSREWRSPETVMDAMSLASMEAQSVTLNHPVSGWVDGSNYRKETRGTVTDVRPSQDTGWVEATVRIVDEEALQAVQGGQVELSCGYTATRTPTPGLTVFDPVTQETIVCDATITDIKYNHLAIVDQARAGHGARLLLDSADNVGVEMEVKTDKIEEREGKFVVLSMTGEVLGTHETKEQAEEQLRAVEASKHSSDSKDAECLETTAPKSDDLAPAPTEVSPVVEVLPEAPKEDAADKIEVTVVPPLDEQLTALQAKLDSLTEQHAKLSSPGHLEALANELVQAKAKAASLDVKVDGLDLAGIHKAVVTCQHPSLKLDSFTPTQISDLFSAVQPQPKNDCAERTVILDQKDVTHMEPKKIYVDVAEKMNLNLPKNVKLDNTTLFTAAELTQVEQKFIAAKRPVFVSSVIPVQSADEGADTYSFTVYSMNNASDQTADGVSLTASALTGTNQTEVIVQYRDQFQVLDQEIRQSVMTGRPVEGQGVVQAKFNLVERLDKMALVGDGTRLGLLNAAGTSTYTIPADGSGSSALWSTKTAALMIRDMAGVCEQLKTSSNGNYTATHLFIGSARLATIRQTVHSDYTAKSILDVFQTMYPGVQLVEVLENYMHTTPVTVTATAGKLSQRLVAADLSNSENVARVVALEPAVTQVNNIDNSTKYEVKVRMGGTIVRQLTAVCIGTAASAGI